MFIKLGDGLILRNLKNAGDAEKFAAFNAANTEYEGATCRSLLSHRPNTRLENFFIVENEIGEAVSTTCLFPWEISFCGITMKAAMTEMVYTRPDYRKRGLVRKQMDNIGEIIKTQNFDLGIINGIPYYYRQFGYSYCLHAMKYENLPAYRVPALIDAGNFSLRGAGEGDAETLARMYAKYAACDIYDLRGAEYFIFLTEHAKYPLYILENAGSAAGYVAYYIMDKTALIRECGLPDFTSCAYLLSMLNSCGANEIKNFGPESSLLVKYAISHGSLTEASDQWLIKIVDIPSFLSKLAPVFNKRLTESGYENLTAELIINLYETAFKLEFINGRLVNAENAGFIDYSMGADGGGIKIPRDAFVRLVFGFNTLDELQNAWPDAIVSRDKKHLADALFPRLDSYLNLPFHYCGPLG